jgi:hypothetical protein
MCELWNEESQRCSFRSASSLMLRAMQHLPTGEELDEEIDGDGSGS